MEIRIKSEREIYSTEIQCSPPKNILPSSPSASQMNSNVTHKSDTNIALVSESQQPKLTPKRQDVSSNRTSPLQNMPAIDLRIVKKERVDEDEVEVQGNPRRSPTRESNGGLHRGSTLMEQEMQSPEIKTGKDSMAFVGVPRTQEDGRASKEDKEDENTINRSRYSKGIEAYPYRVPIVYPIHSPPIDYRSINTAGRSPSPNSYRLEEEEERTSPLMNQRKLYEEAHWPSVENRQDVEFQENHSSIYTGRKSARNSPSQQERPLNCGNQNQEVVKEESSSPKEPTHSFNSGKATFGRRRGKNSERLTSSEDDKEEESLWKQVQRYRHRKRPALGKLYPTQEETIFMQYNEIRERRHREGRIITRTGRPVMSHCNANIEPSRTPPSESVDDQADSKLQVLKQAGPSKPCGMDSFGGQGSRVLGVEFPNSKVLANSCITGPSQERQRSPSFNSTSMDSHQVGQGNTERKKSPNENLETHVKDYQSYSSPSAHACTGQQSQHYRDVRDIDGRGIDARSAAHAAMNRRNQSYEECCHSASAHRTHRPIQPLPRFHLEDPCCYENSCHGNRRRLSSCGHQCCNHIRAQCASCDNADEFNDDNDEGNHWQYSPKEKRSRAEQDSRDVNDLYRRDDQPRTTQNGSRPFSPSSSDSRDNESIENGPTQDFQTENEGQLYENGNVSQEGSPQMPNSESDGRFPRTSPFQLEREPDDDDVICHVNGLFSLPGYRETKYDITRGELKRRTEPPETLTRVEMISYVRQAKTSGRILLDTNGITTSNRSHPTILSRVCEREAQVLACGIHKMNLEYLPLKKLVQICVDMYKSRGCDGCQDCRLKLRRRIVDVEITRNMLKELLHVFQEASTEGFLDSFELASHTFGTMNLVNNIKMIDEYYKLLLLALEKE